MSWPCLWLSYNWDTAAGNFNFSVLEQYRSGYPDYASGTIDLREVSNPGYISPPTTATYFFGGSDGFETEDVHRTDLAVNDSFPFGRFEPSRKHRSSASTTSWIRTSVRQRTRAPTRCL